VAVGILAAACLALSRDGAPLLWKELLRTGWALVLHILTGLVAASALVSLWTRRYGLARLFAMVQVVLIVWGWAFSQFPYVVVPDLTFASAAAPPQVLRLLLFALAAGAVVLFPSLWYLFRLFKQHTGESDANHR
jgi:cytochrome d ubiquinol oxidase subunit II